MLCEKCEKKIDKMQNSRSKCVLCGRVFFSSQAPKETVCDTCAWTKGVCSVCAGELVYTEL